MDIATALVAKISCFTFSEGQLVAIPLKIFVACDPSFALGISVLCIYIFCVNLFVTSLLQQKIASWPIYSLNVGSMLHEGQVFY